ncbi:MAG: hypothetical protein GWO39_04135, partial [Gammaproteobacteria bacterium]|nr:hypothetical protein [Gammaproteobacteria bacterium]NIT63001.1 hypothetical protein [Gammaproteobacteria bacterium]NIV19955.1 hypothetical protein [Gammaproteobacteria bacterium]NIY31581.1 hypothetical protein [Gammaproteobacteria bacterium]
MLRGLLWRSREAVEPDRFAHWRRLVIHSYVLERSAEDAHTAMLRYEQDYGRSGEEWTLLRGRVLLLGGRYGQVKELLSRARAPAARVLYWLAR